MFYHTSMPFKKVFLRITKLSACSGILIKKILMLQVVGVVNMLSGYISLTNFPDLDFSETKSAFIGYSMDFTKK